MNPSILAMMILAFLQVPRATRSHAPSADPPATTENKRHLAAGITLAQLFELLRARSLRRSPPRVEVQGLRATWALRDPALDFTGRHPHGYASVLAPPSVPGQWRVAVVQDVPTGDFEALAHEARDLFIELQAAQARLVAIDEVLGRIDRGSDAVKARGDDVDGGHGARANVVRARWRARRDDVLSKSREIAGRIAVLAGAPGWRPRAEGELKPLGLSTGERGEQPPLDDGEAAWAHARLARALRRLDARRAILDDFRHEAEGPLVELRRGAEAAPLYDRVDAGEGLEALQARAELELTHIDLVEGVMHAEVAVLAASGRIAAPDGLAPPRARAAEPDAAQPRLQGGSDHE